MQIGKILFGILFSLNAQAWQGYLFSSIGSSHFNGYSQIPKGGMPGTSSTQRPSFKEVGVNQEGFFNVALGLKHQSYYAQIDYFHFNPHGNTILTQDLTTHAQFITKGRSFNFETEYHWYCGQMGKDFYIADVKISPTLQVNYLQYDYGFSSPPIASHRAFSPVALGVGLNIEYAINPQLSTYLQGALTFPSNLTIKNATWGLNYQFAPLYHLLIVPRLMIGWLQIDFQDNQTLPNHIHFNALPYGALGILIKNAPSHSAF